MFWGFICEVDDFSAVYLPKSLTKVNKNLKKRRNTKCSEEFCVETVVFVSI